MPSLGQDLERYLLESSKLRLWNRTCLHQSLARVSPQWLPATPSTVSPLIELSKKGQTLCSLSPNSNSCSQWPELAQCAVKDRHKAMKDWPWIQDHQPGNSCPSTRRKLPRLALTPLICNPCARRAVCHLRKRKSLRSSEHVCIRCGWRQGSGLMRKAPVCLGSTDRAAYLRGSLSMPGSCAHCPSGCHPFEERETLMGTKGSSKGKFLLQAGPKVPAIKEIIVVLHLAYLCPLSSRNKSVSLWMDLNFQESVQKHRSIKGTRERQKVFMLLNTSQLHLIRPI